MNRAGMKRIIEMEPQKTTLTSHNKAIQFVACLEAFKGIIVLIAATGLLTLVHKDLQGLAERLVEHTHLNPASKYPHIFIDAAARLHDSKLVLLALGAMAYSFTRFVEAYGLSREKAWAEVLAAASGAIYIPIELYEWFHNPTWFRAAIFAINAVIVIIMLQALV